MGSHLFRGVNPINLDVKGRLAVPKRYRSELQESCECQMIITVALDERCIGVKGCLWLFPLPEWEKAELSISKLPTLNKMTGKLRRFFIGNATETDMDAQGRLLVPEKLRNFAEMEKHIFLVGQLNKFEIWNDAAWVNKEKEWMDGDDTEGLEDLGSLSF